MPQTTDKQATAHNSAWASSANAVDAGETDSTRANATIPSGAGNGATTATLRLTQFGLCTEDGGIIPPGATIISVTVNGRVSTTNSNDGLNLDRRASVTVWVNRNGTALLGATLNPASGANASAGPQTMGGSTGGTQASPQTTFARDDFLNSNSANLGIEIFGTQTAGLVTSNACNVFCYWASLTVTWVKYLDGPGGSRAVASAGVVTKQVQIQRSGSGPVALATDGGQPHSLVSRQATGGVAASRGGAPLKLLASETGGARSSIARTGGAATALAGPSGGGRASSPAAGAPTLIISKLPAGGRVSSTAAGAPKIAVQRQTAGGRASSTAGAPPKPLVSRTSTGAAAFASDAGALSAIITRAPAGGQVSASRAGGPARVFSFSISGIARTSTNAPLADVRCKVYRFSDDAVMGTSISDATGYYAVAIPAQGLSPNGNNLSETFFVRFWKGGSPNMFATTDDNLPLVVSQVQGPP